MSMKAEISFDTIVPDAGSENIEGCYRLEDCDWQVFYATQVYQGDPHTLFPAKWRSGVIGVQIHYPVDKVLNKESVKAVLTNVLGVSKWFEVLGPDSLRLK
jgi:hypothetical protein